MTSLVSESSENESRVVEALNKKNETGLIQYLNERFDAAYNARWRFEKEWYLNLAFYGGKQYLNWTRTAIGGGLGKLTEPPAPPWRVRMVINKLRPMIRGELAKITQEHPQPFVIPASTEEEDISAAKAGERITEHLMRELEYDAVLRSAAWWTLLCGSSFIKLWYDEDEVVDVGDPITGEGQIKGNLKIERITPFHIYVPDLQEETLGGQPWVMHASRQDVDFINAQYNSNLKGSKNIGNDTAESRLLMALGIDSSSQASRTVTVKEAWFKPNKRFPEGAVVQWAEDKVLQTIEGWPYTHGEYPFAKIDHIPSGKFYADSTLVDLRPLQKEYNRTRSQIIENKNRMAKPQLLSPRGAIDANKVTSEPGLVIEYQPGFNPPEPLPMQNLPTYVTDELERIQRDMDDISSQHEITKGSTPPGVTAATAIAYLQEEDDSKLSHTVASIEAATARLGSQMLSLVQQYWSVKRKVKVLGDNLTYESYSFNGADLRNNTDLHVQAGSAAPRSLAAKRAFLMELGDKGWLPPDVILKYLDMAESGRLYHELQIDANQARRENLRMKLQWEEFAQQSEVAMDESGQPMLDEDGEQMVIPGTLPVNDWDNHAAHIDEHNRYRKTQEFEDLPKEAKEVFQSHVDMHKQMITATQGQLSMPGDVMMQEGMMPGQEGQPPPEQGPPQGGMMNGAG